MLIIKNHISEADILKGWYHLSTYEKKRFSSAMVTFEKFVKTVSKFKLATLLFFEKKKKSNIKFSKIKEFLFLNRIF